MSFFLYTAGLPAAGRADGDRPLISRATVYVHKGHIVTDLSCGGLFSEEIAGTVKSGLPAVVELLFDLTSHKNESVSRGIFSYELRYDVWEDVYSIEGGDTTAYYNSFEKMGGAIEALRRVTIVPLSKVDKAAEYSILFSIAVHPLRGTEKRKLEGWVGDTVGGRSSGAWHEQVLNLNDLIQRFFSRGEGTSNRSDWYRTEFFAPRLLPVARNGNDQTGTKTGGEI